MKYTYYAVLSVLVHFDDADFAFILDNAAHHYDATVNASVALGGFLYGAKNRRDFSDGENKEADLTLRQLGLVYKAIEFNPSDQAARLRGGIRKIQIELMEKNEEINKQLNPTEQP